MSFGRIDNVSSAFGFRCFSGFHSDGIVIWLDGE